MVKEAAKLKEAAKNRFLAPSERGTSKAFQVFDNTPELLSIEETDNNENQWHGKVFEFRIIIAICQEIAQAIHSNETDKNVLYDETVKLYDIYRSGNTDTFDIEFEKHFPGISIPESIKKKYGIGISIKFTQDRKTICMGDIISIYDHVNSVDWSLIVGFYTGKDVKTPVRNKIFCFHVNPDYKNELFGECKRETLQEYIDGIKSQATQEEASKYSKDHKPTLGSMSANPKIDSKKQRRCQCTINMTAFKGMLKMNHFIFSKKDYPYLYESMKKRDVSTLKLNADEIKTPPKSPKNTTRKTNNKTPKLVEKIIKEAVN